MLVNSYINIGLVEDPEINVKVNWKDCFEDEHKYFFAIFKTQFAKSLTSSKQSFFSSNSFSNFFSVQERARRILSKRERERGQSEFIFGSYLRIFSTISSFVRVEYRKTFHSAFVDWSKRQIRDSASRWLFYVSNIWTLKTIKFVQRHKNWHKAGSVFWQILNKLVKLVVCMHKVH